MHIHMVILLTKAPLVFFLFCQAMARDVLHGNYVPRTAPCR